MGEQLAWGSFVRSRLWPTAVGAVLATGLLMSAFVLPADAQEQENDPAAAPLAGEYIATTTVTKVERQGSFINDALFRGQTNTSRVRITADGRVLSPAGAVVFSRSGRTVTYSRTYPDGVACRDDRTGEVSGTGPASADFTVKVAEVAEGVAQRLSITSVATLPSPPGCDPGRLIVHRSGDWVRVDGGTAAAQSKDGTLSFVVAASADPLRVAAGEQVTVPVTVTAVATALEQPCAVEKPLARPLTLDAVVLARSGGSRMIGTARRPVNPRGARIDVGSPMDLTTDERGRCSHRTVAEATATVTVPPGTAPGRYPLVPLISGLPRNVGSVDSGRLVLRVVAPAPPPEEEQAEEAAPAAPAAPPAQDVDTIVLADTAGDVGNRAALLAILLGAAAAMFTRLRGRRLRAAGVFAGVVAIGGGVVELVAGGLVGTVDVSRHLASGAFSSVTGAAMAGGFAFALPWMSRPDRDDRRAGPLIPVLLGVWVFALRALDGVSVSRAAMSAAIALVIGLVAVMGGSRTRGRVFGLVGGTVLMALTYLGAVAGDGSGTDARTEAIIALALGGAAVLVTVLVPRNRTTSDTPEPGPGPAPPEAVEEQGHHAH